MTDLLKVRPDLWEGVAKCLTKRGFWNKKIQVEEIPTLESSPSTKIKVPVNRVGGKAEDDEGNTTLPVKINKVESIAILDSGAGVGIATRKVWEAWGKPALRRTRMNLQLADGSLESPVGLLEDVTVTSCGIEYLHTFAIVDFGKGTSYEVILGRPFMRQFQMIQDWGYNYLYLRHDGVITRINLRNHQYRDVTYSPVEEFDSASSEVSDQIYGRGKELWMCSTSCMGLKPEQVVHDRVITDEAYIPVPFSEHLIDPQEWVHALATLTVCAMPKPIKFCDEDGYDVVPILMITTQQTEGPSSEEFYEPNNDVLLGDMVSIRDVSASDYDTTDDGDEGRLLDSLEGYDSDDAIVPEEDLEKIRVLLRGREEIALEFPKEKPKHKFCKSHRKF